jgi:hypothetical protein
VNHIHGSLESVGGDVTGPVCHARKPRPTAATADAWSSAVIMGLDNHMILETVPVHLRHARIRTRPSTGQCATMPGPCRSIGHDHGCGGRRSHLANYAPDLTIHGYRQHSDTTSFRLYSGRWRGRLAATSELAHWRTGALAFGAACRALSRRRSSKS